MSRLTKSGEKMEEDLRKTIDPTYKGRDADGNEIFSEE